jgi:Tfp pilus assembly protein PilF
VGRAVDEIVVVDTGSTDGTAEVARGHRARVVEWAWRDDFAAARNESLRHATGDWVLVLDADERLTPGAVAAVRAAAERGAAAGHDCRLVSRLPGDQPAPAMAAWYCRLFRRQPGVRFEGRVHEQVAPSIRAAGGAVVRSDVTIVHLGYAEAGPEKAARNLALLQLELAERPGDAFTLFNLGLTLQAAGEWSAAAGPLERALAAPVRPLARELRALAWSKLGEGRLREARWLDAAQAARESLGAGPELAVAHHVLGRALFELGRFEEAAGEFARLMGAPADALGMALHARLPALGLALCRLRQRRFAEAAAALEPVVVDDPTGEAVYQLGNAYLGLRRLTKAGMAYRIARARGVADPDLERRMALCEQLTTAVPARPA